MWGGADSILSLYNNIPFDKEGEKNLQSDISQEFRGNEGKKINTIRAFSEGRFEIDGNLAIGGKSHLGDAKVVQQSALISPNQREKMNRQRSKERSNGEIKKGEVNIESESVAKSPVKNTSIKNSNKEENK